MPNRRTRRPRLNRAIVQRIAKRGEKFMLRDLRRGVIRPARSFDALNEWVEASEYALNSRGNFDADLQRLADRADGYDVNVVTDHLNAALRLMRAWVRGGGLVRASAAPTRRRAATNGGSRRSIGELREADDWRNGIEDHPSDIELDMLAGSIRDDHPRLSDAKAYAAAREYVAARRVRFGFAR